MSATPRLYVEHDLADGLELTLDEGQSHYIGRVMRLKAGDPVRLFNGRDGEFAAAVHEVAKRAVTLVLSRRTREQTSGPDLWLAFTPVKKAATDLIVEKAVELGVSKLIPVRTQRCVAQSVRADRFARIASEAAEQSERLDIPAVAEETSLSDLVKSWPADRKLIYCDEAGDNDAESWGGAEGRAAPIAAQLSGLSNQPAALLIGPEGGFTPEERQMLRSKPFVVPVSLGPRILKAETAAIAALSVWQALCGDWAPDN